MAGEFKLAEKKVNDDIKLETLISGEYLRGRQLLVEKFLFSLFMSFLYCNRNAINRLYIVNNLEILK